MKLAYLFAVASVLLTSCAQIKPPTQAEIDAADYGAEPIDYERVVRNFHQLRLKDPSSAQYQSWSKPVKYWFGTRETSTYGYLVCVSINAKNSFGAYTGFQTDGHLIRNGVVVRYFEKGYYGASGQVCGKR
jgi:hypothetical protein